MSSDKPVIHAVVIGGVNWEQLSNCLDSLLLQTTPDSGFQLIISVVDNTGECVLRGQVQAQYPDVLYVGNRHILGFSANNNQVIVKSSGDYVLLINDDTKVLPGSIASLFGCLQSNPCIGVISAQLLNAD